MAISKQHCVHLHANPAQPSCTLHAQEMPQQACITCSLEIVENLLENTDGIGPGSMPGLATFYECGRHGSADADADTTGIPCHICSTAFVSGLGLRWAYLMAEGKRAKAKKLLTGLKNFRKSGKAGVWSTLDAAATAAPAPAWKSVRPRRLCGPASRPLAATG
jgi:hypothetical protein